MYTLGNDGFPIALVPGISDFPAYVVQEREEKKMLVEHLLEIKIIQKCQNYPTCYSVISDLKIFAKQDKVGRKNEGTGREERRSEIVWSRAVIW